MLDWVVGAPRKTSGIIEVAALAASAEVVPVVAITATPTLDQIGGQSR